MPAVMAVLSISLVDATGIIVRRTIALSTLDLFSVLSLFSMDIFDVR